MALKDLVVHVDHTPRSAQRLDVAIALAEANDAHLIGVAVAAEPYLPGFVQADMSETIALLRDSIEQEVRRAKEHFDQRMQRAGISCEFRRAEGEVVSQLALHARYADLVVIGQTDPDIGDYGDLADRLPLVAGRPVLVVPYVGAYPTVGQRVMVAWNGSREAARAVNDALPILEKAKKVTVLAVSTDRTSFNEVGLSAADLCVHLARHSVRAEAQHVNATDIEVGDLVLSHLSDEGVDLLVMGAYGHSPLREVVLGGATRHLLQHMMVPAFLSH